MPHSRKKTSQERRISIGVRAALAAKQNLRTNYRFEIAAYDLRCKAQLWPRPSS